MEKRNLLNADEKFNEHLPDHLQHLTNILHVLSDKNNVFFFKISISELIEHYLSKPDFDENLVGKALLLYWLLSCASELEVTTV